MLTRVSWQIGLQVRSLGRVIALTAPTAPSMLIGDRPKWRTIRMKKSAIVTLLICVAVLAGCVATRPMTEAERDYQQRAEQERRAEAINRGYQRSEANWATRPLRWMPDMHGARVIWRWLIGMNLGVRGAMRAVDAACRPTSCRPWVRQRCDDAPDRAMIAPSGGLRCGPRRRCNRANWLFHMVRVHRPLQYDEPHASMA